MEVSPITILCLHLLFVVYGRGDIGCDVSPVKEKKAVRIIKCCKMRVDPLVTDKVSEEKSVSALLLIAGREVELELTDSPTTAR